MKGLSDEVIERRIAFSKQGLTLKEIGKREGVTLAAIRKTLVTYDPDYVTRTRGRPPSFTEEAKLRLQEEFNAGATFVELAFKHGVTENTIRNYVSLKDRDRAIVEAFEQGASPEELTQQYKFSLRRIRKCLTRAGWVQKRGRPPKFTDAQRAGLQQAYNEGATIGELAEKNQVCRPTVRQHIHVGPRGRRRQKEAPPEVEYMRQLLEKGKTQKEIAREFGVSPQAVHARIKHWCDR